MDQTKVFAYIRVSGDSQLDGEGFPRQTAACRAYAERHNLKIVKIFSEEAVSTEETMRRPAWSAMMDAMVTNGVRTILVERLDRLNRELFVQEATIRELTKLGFTLISAHEPDLMSRDPSRKAFRQMVGLFAEFERDQIVLKLRAARERKREATGRCEGRKPYGYYDGEPETLASIQSWHAEGASLRQIAKRLDEAGVRPRSGREWRHSTLQGLMLRRVPS